MNNKPAVRIAPDLLDEATLRSVIEEFVTRDGTEFSQLATKIAEVHALLGRGEVELWYDPQTDTCNIIVA